MDFGPIAKLFGFGSAPANQNPDAWKVPARQVAPAGFNPNARALQIDGAVGGTAPAPAGAPGRMTPEQAADWQAVGLGQMKLGEFRAKHGFLPQ